MAEFEFIPADKLDLPEYLTIYITSGLQGAPMNISLNERDLLIFAVASIRCLIAKDVLSKEDIMADLGRQNVDAETAFKIQALLNEIPRQ